MNDGFDKINMASLPSHKDQKIQELEKKIFELENKLSEERFYWVFGIVIIVDMIAFTFMESWGGPIAITFLQLLGLVVLAKNCGVDVVVTIIDKIIDGWSSNNNK